MYIVSCHMQYIFCKVSSILRITDIVTLKTEVLFMFLDFDTFKNMSCIQYLYTRVYILIIKYKEE